MMKGREGFYKVDELLKEHPLPDPVPVEEPTVAPTPAAVAPATTVAPVNGPGGLAVPAGPGASGAKKR